MAREIIVAGNWKMNLLSNEAWGLINDLTEAERPKANRTVIIMPQLPLLSMAQEWLNGSAIRLGAQNASDVLEGAYTGETSAELLRQLGVDYCLTGHSERREIYGETDELVARKTKTLIEQGLTPIVCIGETLEEREEERHWEKLKAQVAAIYQTVPKESHKKLIFAYEPIWAIGTGKTATPEMANQVHAFLRTCIEELAGEYLAQSTSILYGGSVKPGNAKELMAEPDIDGVLVGGASLKAEDFSQIINSTPE